jgi:hypothetical protein
VLRREFAALKPAHVPDAPTHASLLAARDAETTSVDRQAPSDELVETTGVTA